MRKLVTILNNRSYFFLAVMLIIINIVIFNMTVSNPDYEKLRFETIVTSDNSFWFQVYYEDELDFTEDCSVAQNVNAGDSAIYFEIPIEMDINNLRLDLGYGNNTIIIHDMSIVIGAENFDLELDRVVSQEIQNDLIVKLDDPDGLVICTNGDDPYIGIDISSYDSIERYFAIIRIRTIVCAIMYCLIVDLFAILAVILVSNKSIQDEIKRQKLYPEQRILVLIVFFICLSGGIMLSTKYCPDEYARFILTDYIFRTGTLPIGYEQEVMIPGWGFSYALRPYLTSLIGAAFMRIASVITENSNVLVTMSRMPSVIATAFTCYFCLKTGNEIFERRIASFSFAVITCFVPQVMFCGMYLNNDSISLTAVAMGVYFLVRGYKLNWNLGSCIGLAAAFALCLLSYYTVCLWGAFACGFCIISCLVDKTIDNKVIFIFKRAVFIAIITICFSGFFFVRNALLHNGDFLGIASEELSRQELIEQGQTLVQYNPGAANSNSIIDMLLQNHAGWIVGTIRSLIACFGYLNIPIPDLQYGEYYALIVFVTIIFAVIMFFKKQNELIYLIFANLTLSSIVVFILSVIQSYYRDYQSQGRYVIIVVLLVGFIFGIVADNLSIVTFSDSDIVSFKNRLMKNIVAATIIFLWILQFIRIWFESMTKMII
ncbi:hypothetical protein SAMN04487928_101167 [Butyrivibrio proteoclasticus]|uniref:Glycosyltransferase RgtA/B/C/D-like domain-containing protein n=1 Tax=Butyrivibrio proteoclasticus TaxID=43305 RepID=A0A1I5PWU0_9FIRM|nr:hypothetical protein [Butyrivibrio proteoclasticus]SFP38091.1 hypothetical protein SAMN04487928_101167 [Butyrivibrio proteoclasticus]